MARLENKVPRDAGTGHLPRKVLEENDALRLSRTWPKVVPSLPDRDREGHGSNC